MSDYLTNLLARTLGEVQVIQPRLASRYEPLRVFQPATSGSRPLQESIEVTGLPDETTVDESSSRSQPVRRQMRTAQSASVRESLDNVPEISKADDLPREHLVISELVQEQPEVGAVPPRAAGSAQKPEPQSTSKEEPENPSQLHMSRHARRAASHVSVLPTLSSETADADEITAVRSSTESPERESVFSAPSQTPRPSGPTMNEPSVIQTPQRQATLEFPVPTPVKVTTKQSGLISGETAARPNARIDLLTPERIQESIEQQPLRLEAHSTSDSAATTSNDANPRIQVERIKHPEHSLRTFSSTAPEPVSVGPMIVAPAPALIVRPHSATRANPVNQLAPTPPESLPAEPNVQVTIGRIEIRASTNDGVRPDLRRRPAPSKLMSLDDYLRERAEGAGK